MLLNVRSSVFFHVRRRRRIYFSEYKTHKYNENLAEYFEDTTETNNKLKHKTRKGQATGSTDPLYSLPYGVLNQIVLKKFMYNYIPSFW